MAMTVIAKSSIIDSPSDRGMSPTPEGARWEWWYPAPCRTAPKGRPVGVMACGRMGAA